MLGAHMESKRWPSRCLRASALLLAAMVTGCATQEANGPWLPIRLHERGVSSSLVLPGRVALVDSAAWHDPALASRHDHDLGVRRLGAGYAGSESRVEVQLRRRESSGRITTHDRAEERSSTVRRR